MKTLKVFLPLALTIVALTSCNKKLFGVVKGKGSNVTEIRPVSGFNSISVSNDVDVIFVQDSVYSLKVTGQSNVLAVLKTEVEGGDLVIDYKKNVWKHNTVTVEVHAPGLSGITVSGSGNVTTQGALASGFFRVKISGSGNIYVASLIASQVESKISGSGNIEFAGGTATTHECTVSGSGDIDATNLQAEHVTATISGSGSITVNAIQTLNATISGSGDIRYFGNPGVNVNISGSGSVIHL